MPARMVRKRAFGSTIGGLLGSLGSAMLPGLLPGVDGRALGSALGSYLPFKRGGKPKKRKVAKKARGGRK
jgi:hypothetical protein